MTQWGYNAVEKEEKVELVRRKAVAKVTAKKFTRPSRRLHRNDSIRNQAQSCIAPKSRYDVAAAVRSISLLLLVSYLQTVVVRTHFPQYVRIAECAASLLHFTFYCGSTTEICNSTTIRKDTGVSKRGRAGSEGKPESKDGIKLAATKRKTHDNIIKAGEGTILKKQTACHQRSIPNPNRKRPAKRENSTDATINYLESMVQELMRLLSMVRCILFIYHAQHTLPKWFQNGVLIGTAWHALGHCSFISFSSNYLTLRWSLQLEKEHARFLGTWMVQHLDSPSLWIKKNLWRIVMTWKLLLFQTSNLHFSVNSNIIVLFQKLGK